MRRYLLAFALWIAGCAAAFAQQTGPIYCGDAASAFPSSATTTKVVSKAATGTAKIYVCGWHVRASAGTIQLVYGTQTTNPCDTGQVVISPLYPAATIGDDQSSNWRGILVPNGNDVCVVTGTGTTAAEAFVYYLLQ